MKKAVIILSVLVLLVSCASSNAVKVSEVKQGQWLEYGQRSHTGQYFAVFSTIPKSKKRYWKVLYQDETNIYFGFVEPKNIFSKIEVVDDIYKIASDEMGKDIPFYKTDNINHLLTNKIEEYLREKGRGIGAKIIDGGTIIRNEEIQYQIEIICYSYHFERRGAVKYKALVIMDKSLNILDVFYLPD